MKFWTWSVMMFCLSLVFFLLVSVGCVDERESGNYTWGEAAGSVGSAYCEARTDCGYQSEDDTWACARHSYDHLCVYERTCGDELEPPGEAREIVTTCVTAIDEVGAGEREDGDWCYWLGYWGRLPAECEPFWDLEPEIEP